MPSFSSLIEAIKVPRETPGTGHEVCRFLCSLFTCLLEPPLEPPLASPKLILMSLLQWSNEDLRPSPPEDRKWNKWVYLAFWTAHAAGAGSWTSGSAVISL